MMANKYTLHIPCGHLDTRGVTCSPPYICPGCGKYMEVRDLGNVAPGATGVSIRGYQWVEGLAKWRRENPDKDPENPDYKDPDREGS